MANLATEIFETAISSLIPAPNQPIEVFEISDLPIDDPFSGSTEDIENPKKGTSISIYRQLNSETLRNITLNIFINEEEDSILLSVYEYSNGRQNGIGVNDEYLFNDLVKKVEEIKITDPKNLINEFKIILSKLSRNTTQNYRDDLGFEKSENKTI